MNDQGQPTGRRGRAPATDTPKAEADLDRMVGAMYGGASATGARTPPSKPADVAMERDVDQALDANAATGPGHIHARVEDGWVELEGRVDSSAARQEAGRVALDVNGVRGVDNRVRLRAHDEPVP